MRICGVHADGCGLGSDIWMGKASQLRPCFFLDVGEMSNHFSRRFRQQPVRVTSNNGTSPSGIQYNLQKAGVSAVAGFHWGHISALRHGSVVHGRRDGAAPLLREGGPTPRHVFITAVAGPRAGQKSLNVFDPCRLHCTISVNEEASAAAGHR